MTVFLVAFLKQVNFLRIHRGLRDGASLVHDLMKPNLLNAKTLLENRETSYVAS